MQRVYLDSNVFISVIRNELGKGFRLLGQDSELFFEKCKDKFIIVLSDLFFEEVEKVLSYSSENVINWFYQNELKIELILSTQEDIINSKIFVHRTHSKDALHLWLAIKSNCNYLITWNEKDFIKITNKIRIRNPKDFIR